MDQYEIRVNQLKKLKFSIFLRTFLIMAALVMIEIFFYYLNIFSWLNFNLFAYFENKGFQYFTVIYFIIFSIIIVIIIAIFLHFKNKKYRLFFLDCIHSECKLEEIFLLEHKPSQKGIQTFICRAFGITSLNMLNSFSDASRKFSLDLINISYRKKKEKKRGTLLNVRYDQEKPGFLQISRRNNCYFKIYDDQEVVQYGTSAGSLLKGFHVFSTYQAQTYLLEKNENAKKIVALEKFFSFPLDLVFDNECIYVFIDGYHLRLEDGLFKRINNSRFNDKIDSIKTMHKTCFEVIHMFDELFLSNN